MALLLGIPVGRADFLARATDGGWDYGRRLVAGRDPERAFDEVYARVSQVAEELMADCLAREVTVYPRVTLEELGRASREHDVLILIAHWRGSLLEPDDLLSGWGERVAAVARETSDGEAFSILLRPDLPLGAALASGSDSPRLRGLAANTLNRLIRGGHFVPWLPRGVGKSVLTGPKILEALSRDFVDLALEGAIRAGNQLELQDGLHDVGTVDATLAEEFSGTLDLSCCTSSVLGTYLSWVRDEALDVIMGDPLLLPGPQLRLVQGTLELMETTPLLPYRLARRVLAQALGATSVTTT